MALSLKDLNRPLLSLVVFANLVAYYLLLTSDFNFGSVSEIISNYENYVPSALLALIVGILNSQLNHEAKARLVFWRWKHPLPGSFAFTKVMVRDTRIDPEGLEAAFGPLPSDPSQQNRLWFKWYREFQNETGISQVHREYLFTRDWTGLSVLLGVVLIPLAFWQMSFQNGWMVTGFFLFQFLLVSQSARNHGQRFVASVLANKSASI